MNIKRNILLNPGPATTTDTVKAAQLVPDICPREREFGDLMRAFGSDLLRVVHVTPEAWATVLFCGSGTIAMDACVSSLVPADGKLLIVNNGAYSARAAEMARAYSVPHIDLTFPIDGLPDHRRLHDTSGDRHGDSQSRAGDRRARPRARRDLHRRHHLDVRHDPH